MFAVTLLAITSMFASNEAAYLDRIDALRHPDGLFLDRSSDPNTISSAATGFGVLALAEGASRGLRDTNQVSEIARIAFDKTTEANPERNRGWLSHFTDPNGNPKVDSEVSTIDTAIFYASMLRAATLLNDAKLQKDVEVGLAAIDRNMVLKDGVFLHGFYWPDSVCTDWETCEPEDCKPDLIPYKWNDSSEGLILYRLFNLPFPMEITRLDYPLFVYAYPLVFYEVPEYENLLQEVIRKQIDKYGYWGVTSTDGPTGYVTYSSDVISPVLISAISTKYPQYLDPLKSIAIKASVVSMHVPTGWTSTDELTIDLASAYVLYAKWSTTYHEERLVSENAELLR
jgi:hypothetical protein